MLAIVIPYYKLTFFEATLKSLANQTDKRFKVYVGDDDSMESPVDLLKNYKGKIDFDYHRFETNLGSISLSKQWERCIALIEDEKWIMILGDDDYLGVNVIASWYENYDLFNQKSEVIRFATKLKYEETNTFSDVYTHPIWEIATDSFYRKFNHLTRSSLSEHIFSKSSYLKYGFYNYPLAWNSDDHAWLEFSDNKPIFTLNESVVFIRISALNISGKTDNVATKYFSEILFYKFMVSNKLKSYNDLQRDRLLRRCETEIKNVRNINVSEWFFLLYFYFKYFDNVSFLKFIKRFINSILKRHES
jgi:hypothetical protein